MDPTTIENRKGENEERNGVELVSSPSKKKLEITQHDEKQNESTLSPSAGISCSTTKFTQENPCSLTNSEHQHPLLDTINNIEEIHEQQKSETKICSTTNDLLTDTIANEFSNLHPCTEKKYEKLAKKFSSAIKCNKKLKEKLNEFYQQMEVIKQQYSNQTIELNELKNETTELKLRHISSTSPCASLCLQQKQDFVDVGWSPPKSLSIEVKERSLQPTLLDSSSSLISMEEIDQINIVRENDEINKKK
ncbi:hypothetical protein RFI_22187 [Reticulomyxa filosa]|uniref:Uncharacterized protein n=1 Tax=Reticulomyxa filosa TaxID=46433 RepID=X6MMT2_RETFI|nr:hypothetical protein RFI_22187 [Reticulomyxa filosa]|eukprot:ETO15179.1 hypothetical protein RFI_22187 [Reticulomyxa filosa]